MRDADARAIFFAALEQSRGENLADVLDRECAGDAELRGRVEDLLRAHQNAGNFLNGSSDGATVDLPSVTEKPGGQVGPYKLLQQIGEGGMGVVFMAEQKQPVKRRVALKIIKPGMDTRQVVARFEAERQALALMDHPNIAKVFDAGSTQTGRPYFVMEMVNGLPLTEYCDEQQLTPRERLELFVPVCQAVQHAHQKGIIHRDLKPSNILVALYDGRVVPKIIDFGVAKATSQTLTDKTMFTQLGQVVGTFGYMSPEQAQRNQLDIDTRSDIYSLGVVLYELLIGETPFDRERLRCAAFDEVLRILREEEPAKPSRRLSASQSLPSIATNRRIEPAKLGSMIRGELDWIVMKAMDKDRDRRYETASQLAEDVRHYLDDEPVEACPPSTTYRLRKFLRRNKAPLLTASTVTSVLIVAAAISVQQAVVAKRALSSERIVRQRAEEAETRANAEAKRSNQVALFLTDMLAAAGPSVARGRDATLLKEVLEQTSKRVESDLNGQTEVQGDLWYTLACTYQDIGDHHSAITMFDRAASCFQDEPGEPSAKLAVTLTRLGFSHSFLKHAAKGRRVADSGLEMARRVGDKETLADCLYYRAKADNEFGLSSSEAIPYVEESLKLYRELGHHRIAEANCIRALAAHNIDSAESESQARQAAAIFREHLGPDHPNTLGARWLIAQSLLHQARGVEAESLLRSILATWAIVFSDDHPHTYVIRNHFACSLALQDKWTEAYAVIRETRFTMVPKEHRFDGFFRQMIETLASHGRVDDVERVLQRIRAMLTEIQSTYGPDHEYTSLFQRRISGTRSIQGVIEDDGASLGPRSPGLEHDIARDAARTEGRPTDEEKPPASRIDEGRL